MFTVEKVAKGGRLQPLNAFLSLVIKGLVKVKNVDVGWRCNRGTSTAKYVDVGEPDLERGGERPPRPPSKFPPAGELCLRLCLVGKAAGSGRVGTVFEVNVEEESEGYQLLPLVVKVAGWKHGKHLATEAWFYEEMEAIQRASIARCYALFTAEVDEISEVLSWGEGSGDEVGEEGVKSKEGNEDAEVRVGQGGLQGVGLEAG